MKIKLTPFEKPDFERLISWLATEEILVTIAGTDFTYPLDAEQLSEYIKDPLSHAFNAVNAHDEVIGHAELILMKENICTIDKVIIGDEKLRGKGIGGQLIRTLVDYAFDNMSVSVVELNVYDWNHPAIRCYEKVGFIKNPGKEQETSFGDKNWLYFNMSIGRNIWKK